MKKQSINVTTVGTPNIDKLTEYERKSFYLTLLARVLELRKQQLEDKEK